MHDDSLTRFKRAAATVFDVAATFAQEVDQAGRFPTEAVAALKAHKMLSCGLSPRFGVSSIPMSELAAACTLLGKACGTTGMIYAMHLSQLITLDRHCGVSAHISNFLARCVAEELLIASSTSERVAEVLDEEFESVTEGESVRFVKDCPTISYGAHADAILAVVPERATGRAAEQLLVLLQRGEMELVPTARWDSLGMRGTCSDGYLLKACVSKEALLADGFRSASSQTMTPVAHILWAAVWLGIASAAAEAATRFHTVRSTGPSVRAFGSAHLVASTQVDVAQMADLVASATRRWETQPQTWATIAGKIAANNLKIAASDLAVRICLDSLSYCGVAGYLNSSEYSVARFLRDALSAPLMISNERIKEINSTLLLTVR